MHRVFLVSAFKQTRLLMLFGHSCGSNFGHKHFAFLSHIDEFIYCGPGRWGRNKASQWGSKLLHFQRAFISFNLALLKNS